MIVLKSAESSIYKFCMNFIRNCQRFSFKGKGRILFEFLIKSEKYEFNANQKSVVFLKEYQSSSWMVTLTVLCKAHLRKMTILNMKKKYPEIQRKFEQSKRQLYTFPQTDPFPYIPKVLKHSELDISMQVSLFKKICQGPHLQLVLKSDCTYLFSTFCHHISSVN